VANLSFMIENIECTNPAYVRLEKHGLIARISKKKNKIHDMSLYNGFDDSDKIIEELKQFIKAHPGSNEENELQNDLSLFFYEIDEPEREDGKEDYYNSLKFEHFAGKHPSFLASYALGRDVLRYREFEFPSRRRLDEAVAAFCLGERQVFGLMHDNWVWRNMPRNLKNEISLNMHGDLYASQCDVSGNEHNGLFPEIVLFESMKDAEKKSVFAHQDWSQFLTCALKYAQYLGKEKMPEIVNWREVLESIGGGVGTNTAEAFGGTASEWEIDMLMETPLLEQGKSPSTFPLALHSRESSSIAYLSDGMLAYVREDEHGKPLAEFKGTRIEDRKFSRFIEYDSSDLPQVLKASYKYFARDRSILPKIMEKFIAGLE
jgi:hypothetical protein